MAKDQNSNLGFENLIDSSEIKELSNHELARIIDHTLLKPEASSSDITRICNEAKEHHFASVCVNVSNIKLAAKLLADSKVKPIAVIGFPLGATTTNTKVFETKEAISAGAQEIDMVINLGALKSKNYKLVHGDICAVVEAAQPYDVKVILETSLLNHSEKIAACVLAKAAGATFVKTSTGFQSGGATVEDLELMRSIIGPDMHIKASGGIRTKNDATKMVAAGADRIGASASVAMVSDQETTADNY